MSCDASDEYYSVERISFPRARKEHQCCACNETIRRGDLYEYFFALFEGEVATYKRCLRCRAIYQELVKRSDPSDYEGAAAWALDCGHTWFQRFWDEPPQEVARLAFLTPDEMQRELAP